MLLALCLSVAGCSEVLVRGLDEASAGEVMAALAAARIPASRQRDRGDRFLVEVSAEAAGPAWAQLRALGLPRAPAAPPPGRWVVGPAEARAQERQAQAAALEQTLEALGAVRTARVTLTEAGAAVVLRVDDARVGPTAEALVRAAVPPGAAVEVRLEPIVLPPPWSPPAGAPSVALSALVAALTLACGALLVQLRRVRRSRA